MYAIISCILQTLYIENFKFCKIYYILNIISILTVLILGRDIYFGIKNDKKNCTRYDDSHILIVFCVYFPIANSICAIILMLAFLHEKFDSFVNKLKDNAIVARFFSSKKIEKSDNISCVGNVKSKKFHYECCRFAINLQEENKIVFDSKHDDIEQGYKECGICNHSEFIRMLNINDN